MARYNPPTKVTTISIPLIALVNRADPDRERMKHREPEYYEWSSHNKIFLADPYKRGAYNIPVKRNIVNYAGPTTFAQGDLTGVGNDFVYVSSTNPSPGTLTTRTAAQMFADIANAAPGLDYNLRVINIGGGTSLFLAPGAGVGFIGNQEIVNNTFSDIRVYFTDSQDCIMTVWTSGNPYNSSPH